ncbi:Uncharacterised protein [Enterobacter cloacae]|nr:Uncharacterised protein [Enterobacter cloacae]
MFQTRGGPLQQIRQHNRHQKRCQQATKEEQDTESGNQNDQQSNGFRIAKPTPIPLH